MHFDNSLTNWRTALEKLIRDGAQEAEGSEAGGSEAGGSEAGASGLRNGGVLRGYLVALHLNSLLPIFYMMHDA